jgi:hypothetical protein
MLELELELELAMALLSGKILPAMPAPASAVLLPKKLRLDNLDIFVSVVCVD